MQKQHAVFNDSIDSKNHQNEQTIHEYLDAMDVEINPSENYKKLTYRALDKFSSVHKRKNFEDITRQDILSFLNSIKRPEQEFNNWIGTYNLNRVILIRFFKWLYCKNCEPRSRPKPEVVNNVSAFKRKEVSIYKPTDLWTPEDDMLFLKYCPSTRDRCYHAISRDLSARPHEILNLKIKDIVFKLVGTKQYAEVLINGKTGTRHLPLIDSLPYVKDWLNVHPKCNNPNSYLICNMFRRNMGMKLPRNSLLCIYTQHYRKNYFPKLLKDHQSLPNEDYRKIRELLKKPWNLYIRRHSSLTQKSKFLKENILRQHAGWTPQSQMHLKYVHYFGNESSESILQEYGILPKDIQETDVLRPKQCPNCNESNRPDQKFCVKCRMVLTYDAYSETIEEKQIKDKQIEEMMQKQEQFEQLIQSLIDSGQLKPGVK